MEGRKLNALLMVLVLFLGMFVGESTASFKHCYGKCFDRCIVRPPWSPAICGAKCLKKCIWPIYVSHDFCKLGCASSQCTHLSTKEKPGEKEVENCVGTCSEMCAKNYLMH